MADTYTTNLNLTKPEPGAAEDTWGISLNADLDSLDAIFSSSGTQINLNPNQINFADGKKAVFGTGSDLSIYHDGSNSYIKDTGTGNLRISGTQVDILNPDSNEFKARFKTDGAVELYHDNSKKFETTSSGADILGTLTSDGLTVNGAVTVNSGGYTSSFGNTENNNAIQVSRTGTNPSSMRVVASSNAPSFEWTGTSTLKFYDTNSGYKTRLAIAPYGDISFYDDTGTSQNLKWDASADTLNFVDNAKAFFGTGNDLQIYHAGNYSVIDNLTHNLVIRNQANNSDILLQSDDGAGSLTDYLKIDGSTGETKLFHYGSEKISTKSTGIDVTGTTVTDGLTVNSGDTSSFLTIRNGSNSSFTKLYSDLNGVTILDVDANNVGSSPRFQIDVSEVQALRITEGGDISFYDDTGTTQGLLWDASAERLGIGTTSPTRTVDIHGDIGIQNPSYFSGAYDWSFSQNGTNGGLGIKYYGSEKVTVTNNGKVGIGTDSPSEKLHVSGNAYISDGNYFTESTSGYFFSGAGNYDAGIYATGTTLTTIKTQNNLSIVTNNSEALRIDSSQRVGIGTSSPSTLLHIKDNVVSSGVAITVENESASASFARLKLIANSETSDIFFDGSGGFVSGGGLIYRTTTNRSHHFYAGSNALMSIRNSGNIGIGTTSPSTTLELSNASTAPILRLSNENNSVAAGGDLGVIEFYSGDDSGFGDLVKASISATQPLTSPVNGELVFKTSSSSTSLSEAMRISANGSVGIGTDSPTQKLHISSTTTNPTGIGLQNSQRYYAVRSNNFSLVFSDETVGQERARIDSSGNLLVATTDTSLYNNTTGEGFSVVNSELGIAKSGSSCAYFNRMTSDGDTVKLFNRGVQVGSISTTSSATTYNTSSDARLKDVTGEARGLEVITKLNPVAYNWKADGKADEGLIAQEVKELVPNAVTGSEDEHYQMDYSKLVTHLVKGMKEQQEQIEFLKEEIANLKGE